MGLITKVTGSQGWREGESGGIKNRAKSGGTRARALWTPILGWSEGNRVCLRSDYPEDQVQVPASPMPPASINMIELKLGGEAAGSLNRSLCKMGGGKLWDTPSPVALPCP